MPESIAGLLGLLLRAAPLLSLLLAGWTVGRVAERAVPCFGLSRVAIAGLTPALVFAALATARLATAAPHWRVVLAHPLDLLRVNDQLSFFGGAAGAVIALVLIGWRAHLPLWSMADAYGMAAPLGFAVHGLGCLPRNDCYGRAAPPPFGIVFPGLQVPRVPVELYAAAAALLAYAGLQRLARRRPGPGTVALTSLVALGASRALLDTLRLGPGGGYPAVDQLFSLAVAALALVLLQARLLRSSAGATVAPTASVQARSIVGGSKDLAGGAR